MNYSNPDGFISQEMFANGYRDAEPDVSDEKINEAFLHGDKDEDGQLN